MLNNDKILKNLIEKVENSELSWTRNIIGDSTESYTCDYNITKDKIFKIEIYQTKLCHGYNYYIYLSMTKNGNRIKKGTKHRIYYQDNHEIFKLFLLIKYKYYLSIFGERRYIEQLKEDTLSSEMKWRSHGLFFTTDLINCDQPKEQFCLYVWKGKVVIFSLKKDKFIKDEINYINDRGLYEFLKNNVE